MYHVSPFSVGKSSFHFFSVLCTLIVSLNSLVPRSHPLLAGAGSGHETNRSMASVAAIEAWEQDYGEPENVASSTVRSVE